MISILSTDLTKGSMFRAITLAIDEYVDMGVFLIIGSEIQEFTGVLLYHCYSFSTKSIMYFEANIDCREYLKFEILK